MKKKTTGLGLVIPDKMRIWLCSADVVRIAGIFSEEYVVLWKNFCIFAKKSLPLNC